MSAVYEEVTVLPFQAPSAELFELLAELKHAQDSLCCVEWNREELRGLGELTPLQVDALLSGRTR